MVEQLAKEYSKYFQEAGISKEIDPICSSIDQMLNRLDEFQALMSTVKNEATVTTQNIVPELLSRKAELQELYTKIDNLDRFIGVVASNLDTIEEHVVNAEEELGINALGLKGLLMPFLGIAKKRIGSSAEDTNGKCKEPYQPPTVFRTSDFFQSNGQEGQDHEIPVDLEQFEI